MSKKKEDIQAEEQEAALTILRNVARVVAERAEEFKTQELSNTLWAFATLGFGVPASEFEGKLETASLNDYVVLSSDNQHGDEELLTKAANAIIESGLPRIGRFRSQELNNMAWSLARMDRTDSTEFLEAIGLQLCNEQRRLTSQVRTLKTSVLDRDLS